MSAVHQELASRGVGFARAPAAMGPNVTAKLDDTTGILIQLMSPA